MFICVSCVLFVGTNADDIVAIVTSPSGVDRRCDITSESPGVYHVSFLPCETGEHIINVRHKQASVPG